MPEAPELQVVKEVLQRALPGQSVLEARVLKPTVLRSLVEGGFTRDIPGRRFEEVGRRGKSLRFRLSGDRLLAIFPMLTGALQYCPLRERLSKKTCLVLLLSSGMELRYLNDRQMGMVYYLAPAILSRVRRMEEGGPDVLEEPLSYQEFLSRLKKHRGEIKGVLTRGRLVSGIGNAYADEVLFDAGIFPFRQRRDLKEEELKRLHQAIYSVPRAAVEILRVAMGERIDIKVREFMKVHGKGGGPCPRCGGRITTISAHQRITNYCRRCQPGMLVRN